MDERDSVVKIKNIFKVNISGKKVNRSSAGNFMFAGVLGIVSLFMSLPFVYSIIQSIKPIEEQFMFPPRFFVTNPTINNFTKLFELTNNLWVPFSRYLCNSLFVSLVGTIFYIFIASLSAYPLAKSKFPGKKIFNAIVVYSLLFTNPVTGVAQYVIIAKTGILNSYWSVFLPTWAGTFGLYLMRQFMVQMVPDEVIESSKIDGANTLTTFFKIVMPMVKPAWLTLIIFTFQSLWNGTGSNFLYTESLKFLPTVLGQISSSGIARVGVGSAAAIVLLLPTVIIFLVLQSKVLETMAHSGIK